MEYEKNDISSKEAIIEVVVNCSIKDTATKETSAQTGEFFRQLLELAESFCEKSEDKLVFRVCDGVTVTHSDRKKNS